MPYSEPPRRFAGVKEFDISIGRRGANGNTGGISRRIAYIEAEHTKEEVVEAWCQVNQGVVERADAQSLYRATPEEFRDAFREHVDFEHPNKGRSGVGDFEGVCGLCGEEYEGTLPKHLRNDCDG